VIGLPEQAWPVHAGCALREPAGVNGVTLGDAGIGETGLRAHLRPLKPSGVEKAFTALRMSMFFNYF
jgi:hypothetical protein